MLGNASEGGVATNSSLAELTVIFQCYGTGVLQFSLSLSTPPFDPITIFWNKKSDGMLFLSSGVTFVN